MSVADNLNHIIRTIPKGVALVAVSKTKPISELMKAYDAGQRIFGENRIQEMTEKQKEMPEDVEWHMIGHVQRNKVKYIASFVALIHAVDSLKLLKEINKQAEKNDRSVDCLLQIKIAKEESKFGLNENDALNLLNSEDIKACRNVRIIGLMGMATFTSDEQQLNKEFESLHQFYESIKGKYQFNTLSMGMSDDFPIALENGSTMIRVGSAIFGRRD